MKKFKHIILSGLCTLILLSCTISYKFNGTVIDYSVIKTISIQDFTNQAAMVYAPLANVFNEELKDTFTRQTRLTLERSGGDLEIFWNEQTNEVEMTGPAEFVFDGEVKT